MMKKQSKLTPSKNDPPILIKFFDNVSCTPLWLCRKKIVIKKGWDQIKKAKRKKNR